MSKDGTSDYIITSSADQSIGDEDFTVDFYIENPLLMNALETMEPQDGRWHHVGLGRSSKTMTTSGEEYVDGVLFHVVKRYGEDGKLETSQYTRGDLVKG